MSSENATELVGSIHQRFARLGRCGLAAAFCVYAVLVWLGPALGVTAMARSEGATGSLAVGLGSGLVDERTGLVGLGFEAGSVGGVPVGVRFEQSLVGRGDRSGLGDGWTFGLPFVSVDAGELVVAGRSLVIDESAESGLRGYGQQDSVFERVSMTTPGGSRFTGGRPAAYRLRSVTDGSNQYFDAAGDLLTIVDRFGRVVEFQYDIVGEEHRLVGVTGALGQRLVVRWEPSRVIVVLPQRSDQEAGSELVIEQSGGRVVSVEDQTGGVTQVEWTDPLDASGLVLVSAVKSPWGARTEFSYRHYPAESGGVWAVESYGVEAPDGSVLSEEVTVDLDPKHDGRTYTGCPEYCPQEGRDVLAESGDGEFTYTTRTAQGDRQVLSTFSHLHQLIEKVTKARINNTWQIVRRESYDYPRGTTDRLKDAPPAYQLATKATVTAADGDRGRSVVARVSYDKYGRPIEERSDGVLTTTTYGPNSLPTRVVSRDEGSGRTKIVENELTDDESAIARSVTFAVSESGADPQRVSSVEYEYYEHGALAGEVRRMAESGARDAGGVAVTETEIELDLGAGLRTDAVRAPDGSKAVTVSDVASGVVLSSGLEGHPQTEYRYDDAGRVVEQVAPDGSVTSMTYEERRSAGGAVVATRRDADGFATRTLSDALGRPVETQDNYAPADGALLPDQQWRTTESRRYDTLGQLVAVADVAGRETTMSYDALGREVEVRDPTGARVTRSYDDVANTTSKSMIAAGKDAPMQTSVSTLDDGGREIKRQTSYADGTPGTVAESKYDAFGTPQRTWGTDPFVVEHAYGPTGAPAQDTLTPTPAAGDAPAATADYGIDEFGRVTSKTLSAAGEQVKALTETRDAAGRVTAWANPMGETTTFEYGDDGTLQRTVGPDGVEAHVSYDELGRPDETWTMKDGVRAEQIKTAYDEITGQPSAVWRVADRDGSEIRYRYNPDSSVAEITYPGDETVRYAYDEIGQVASITDVTGARTEYRYDASSGHLTSARQLRDGSVLAEVEYTYGGAGRLTGIVRHGDAGARTGYVYNDAGQLIEENHRAVGGAELQHHRYTYNESGKRTSDVATIEGGTTAHRYVYTGEGRLRKWRHTTGDQPGEGQLIAQEVYATDLAANLTEVEVSGPKGQQASTFDHDAANRTRSVTTGGEEATPQAYDGAGNLIEDAEGRRYTYNTVGQLTDVEDPVAQTKTAYTYYPTGQRATQTVVTADRTDTLTYYYDADGSLITETDGTGSAIYLMGVTREARTLTTSATTTTRYYLTNVRGDVVGRTDPTATEVTHAAYTPYGTPIALDGNTEPDPATEGKHAGSQEQAPNEPAPDGENADSSGEQANQAALDPGK